MPINLPQGVRTEVSVAQLHRSKRIRHGASTSTPRRDAFLAPDGSAVVQRCWAAPDLQKELPA